MKILVYKRTHTGDPDALGRFGINGCMGQIRHLDYDAVIGVGGTGKEPQSFGIDRKITWVGVNPTRQKGASRQRPGVVTFERYAVFDAQGPYLHVLAPALARRMYAGRRFVFTSMTAEEHAEATELLSLAEFDVPTLQDRIDLKSCAHPCIKPKRARSAKARAKRCR